MAATAPGRVAAPRSAPTRAHLADIHHHRGAEMTDAQELGSKTRVALLSVISNTVLVLLKLAVGISIGAVSIISEAVHSAVDLLAAIIAMAAIRVSGRQADADHPFGHGKYENISGAIEALLIFVTAIWIVWEAVRKLQHPEPMEAVDWGVAVMLVSVIASILVSSRLFKVGKETDSIAITADAWHLRTDVYTSLGVMVGLGAIWVGRRILPGVDLEWVDPVAAIAVAALITKAAWHLTAESVRGLLDTGLRVDELAWIRDLLAGLRPQVIGYHHLHTRKAGATRSIEVHIVVDGDLTVTQSHALTERIDAGIRERFPRTRVMVHVEPCGHDCDALCRAGCLVPERQRPEIDP